MAKMISTLFRTRVSESIHVDTTVFPWLSEPLYASGRPRRYRFINFSHEIVNLHREGLDKALLGVAYL